MLNTFKNFFYNEINNVVNMKPKRSIATEVT